MKQEVGPTWRLHPGWTAWLLCLLGLLACIVWLIRDGDGGARFGVAVFAVLAALGVRDLRQPQRAVLRNYPVIGHLRFFMEYIRPEIRQYFIESDTEAAPFSRAQRSLVYQRAKGAPDNRPFGTQIDVMRQGYEWINHSMFPTTLTSSDFRLTIGAGRPQPYLASVFNISAMSFGSLSSHAILALNQGAKMGGFAHDTGEGSISRHHRVHGGDLIWEIGSGYFGCRDAQGHFDPVRFAENARDPQVKMIEIKLSQGAKPGHGGILPGAKVTPEIAQARGVPEGVDCISPSAPSTTMKSGVMPVCSIALTMPNHSQGWPTHSLKPTGLPPESSRKRSMKAIISSGVRKALCEDGEMQSTPSGTPRACAISGVTLAPGRMPPWPGLAP